MSRYLDTAELIAEAEKKLFEAEKNGLPSAAYFAGKWKEASDIADPGQKAKMRTALYHEILDDLHWHYGKRSVGRKIFHHLGDSALRLTVILFLFTLCPFLPLPGGETLGAVIFPKSDDSIISHFYGLYTACSFGLLGAMFSRLINFKSNFEDLGYDQLLKIWGRNPLYIRLLLGMIGSLVVFYAIFGNFLGGELFPDVTTMKFDPAEKPSMDFAKLVIWCFVGRFSERLVPDFLTRTETSAAKSA